MTAITGPPSILSSIFGSYISFTGKSSEDLKVGQIVISDPVNVGYWKAAPANGSFAGLIPMGVSISDVAAWQDFTMMTNGIAYVINGDDTIPIPRGTPVVVGGYAGCVVPSYGGDTVVGIAIDLIPGNGFGRIVFQPITPSNRIGVP